MRNVIYATLVSLDGFINGPGQELDWHIIDEEIHTHVNEHVCASGAFLLGRHTYEVLQGFWPTADADPSHPEYIVEYARIWKRTPKLVFSRTLEAVEGNARLVRDNAADEVAILKTQPGGDLQVGGALLASTLMRSGLIDTFCLYVHPVILGGGTPVFSALGSRIPLRLEETRRFNSGVVLLRYQRTDPA